MIEFGTKLSWMLIHSLWIGFLLWICLAVGTRFLSKPTHRNNLRYLALFAFLVASLSRLFTPAAVTYEGIGEYISSPTSTSVFAWFTELINTNSIWINCVWLLGLAYGLGKIYVERRSLLKLKRSAVALKEESILSSATLLANELGIGRKVKLLVTPLINSPITVGVLKPIIYFPVGLSSWLSPEELETIILHELSHIKRWDYLVNIFLSGLETIFFFNPMVLMVIRDCRKDMEFSCDDHVLKYESSKLIYARTLLRLQEHKSSGLALAARGKTSEFAQRLQRIVEPKNKVQVKVSWMLILFVVFSITASFTLKNQKEIPEENAVVSSLSNADSLQNTTIKEQILTNDIAITDQDQKTLSLQRLMQAEERLIELRDKSPGMASLRPENRLELPKDEKGKLIEELGMSEEKLKLEFQRVATGHRAFINEVQEELIKDGILNQERLKITLMFQYSDVLNGKSALGDKYEKYKNILNKHFPGYDSYATTRVFRFN